MKEIAGFFLSFLPRSWLQEALLVQWEGTLSCGERARLRHFGATGNPDHHEFQWADRLNQG